MSERRQWLPQDHTPKGLTHSNFGLTQAYVLFLSAMSIMFIATAISPLPTAWQRADNQYYVWSEFKCTRGKFYGIYPFSLRDVHTSIQYANNLLTRGYREELRSTEKSSSI